MKIKPLEQTMNNRITIPRSYFILIASIAILLYYDIVNHYWFVKLLNGYLIRIWIPPFILFLCVLIRMMAKRENIFTMRSINIPLLFYAFSGLAAMLLNESLISAIKYYLVMIGPVWFYAVLTDGLVDNKDIERILKILFFCGLFFCLQTAYYRIQSHGLAMEKQEIITSAGNAIEFGGVPEFKKKEGKTYVVYSRGVLNVEHGNYSGMLTPLVLFGFLFFIHSRTKIRFLYLAISLLMIAQIIDTMSRIGMITIFIGMALLIWYLFRYKPKLRVKLIIFISLIFVLGIIYIVIFNKTATFVRLLTIFNIFQLPSFLHNILATVSHYKIVDPHVATMFTSFKTFLANPFFGTGYVFKGEGPQELNRYLFLLASSGIFVFVSYILFYLGLIFLVRKIMLNFASIGSNAINYGYLFFPACIAFLFKLNNQGQELYYYWIIFALASAWIRNTKKENLIEPEKKIKT